MPDWIWGVAVIAACLVVPFAWGALSDRNQAAAAVGEAAGSAVAGVRWLFMKACGVVALLIGVAGIYLSVTGSLDAGFGGVALCLAVGAYGLYLLLPGGPDDKFWLF